MSLILEGNEGKTGFFCASGRASSAGGRAWLVFVAINVVRMYWLRQYADTSKNHWYILATSIFNIYGIDTAAPPNPRHSCS